MITLKRRGRIYAIWMVLLVSTLALTGCAGNSTPSTFFMLRSIESPQETLATAGGESVSVLVGPVSIPEYLDRNQMVTVAENNRVMVDEFNRWAESLRESFYRVLLEDLSFLLKTPEVARYDRSGEYNSDYQVFIDVTRFDCAPEGDAVLIAFWTVRGKDGATIRITKKSVFRTPVSSTGYPGMVQAQNRTLSAFGREIAIAIKSFKR